MDKRLVQLRVCPRRLGTNLRKHLAGDGAVGFVTERSRPNTVQKIIERNRRPACEAHERLQHSHTACIRLVAAPAPAVTEVTALGVRAVGQHTAEVVLEVAHHGEQLLILRFIAGIPHREGVNPIGFILQHVLLADRLRNRLRQRSLRVVRTGLFRKGCLHVVVVSDGGFHLGFVRDDGCVFRFRLQFWIVLRFNPRQPFLVGFLAALQTLLATAIHLARSERGSQPRRDGVQAITALGFVTHRLRVEHATRLQLGRGMRLERYDKGVSGDTVYHDRADVSGLRGRLDACNLDGRLCLHRLGRYLPPGFRRRL